MAAYLADSRAIAKDRLEFAWKALKAFWGDLLPEHITRENCRRYVAQRRQAGRQDGTIRREMNVLAAGVRWAGKNGVFELPSAPDPKDRWLNREEFAALMDAAVSFHVATFLHLAIATAARKEALLTLTWPQVRFAEGQIWLGKKANGKNRATVPMTTTLRAVLQRAKELAQTEFVVEYKGERVKNIRKAFELTVARAGLGSDVTPHILRHTAAVWMAAAGTPMPKIALYLGHTDSRITEKVYARFAPEHLHDAAAALDVGQCSLVQNVVHPRK